VEELKHKNEQVVSGIDLQPLRKIVNNTAERVNVCFQERVGHCTLFVTLSVSWNKTRNVRIKVQMRRVRVTIVAVEKQ
jgi:hypothetical protein